MLRRLTINIKTTAAITVAMLLMLSIGALAYSGIGRVADQVGDLANRYLGSSSSSTSVGADSETDWAAQLESVRESMLSLQRSILITVGIAMVVGGMLVFLVSRNIASGLARLIYSLRQGAEHVYRAAGEIARSSQELAQGASDQAVSLEETSAVLSDIAQMTHKNSDDARSASGLSCQAREAAENMDQTMNRLSQAMSAMNESSSQIKRIIRVIEEIAFQTNLLALNAAVEAARAGEHGRGFAVVADEVRSLAQRSAEAARETTTLIENSVNRVHEGAEVAGEVVSGLGGIVRDVGEVTSLINRIAEASAEQTMGVDQATHTVNQMDSLTQQNAANAAESASSVEQLSEQAAYVKRAVDALSRALSGAGSTETKPEAGQSESDVASEPVVAMAGAPAGAALDSFGELSAAGDSLDGIPSLDDGSGELASFGDADFESPSLDNFMPTLTTTESKPSLAAFGDEAADTGSSINDISLDEFLPPSDAKLDDF